MIIENPTWYMTKICPHCGQGSPSFCYCENCGFVTVRCEEVGEVFKDPKKLNDGFTRQCPNCKIGEAEDFRTASAEQIINAGFKKNDYK